MVQPVSSFSIVNAAVVRMVSGVRPALPNSAESAIEKQPACAATINYSGLVPGWSSKRVLNEYGVCLRTPLSVETVPLPSFSPPCHVADAERFIIFLSLFCYGNCRRVRSKCDVVRIAVRNHISKQVEDL